MRILIAPDKFKDALTAPQAAAAMARGVADARHNARVTLCPLADGGEGSGALLASALGATETALPVTGPLGDIREARWWRTFDGSTAILEMAEACGLQLLSPGQRNPVVTTSKGVGELIWTANKLGCTRILVCVGGSATVDGGAGCLATLGWRFHVADGSQMRELPCGGMLPRIAEIHPPVESLRAKITVLCDVNNPPVGPRGAARSFAEQKGATPGQVEQLDAAMNHWAGLLHRATGRDVSHIRGGGAAGGIAAGLAAAYGAEIVRGFDFIAECVDLRDRLRHCDVCLTGEGRLDAQTASGKVVAGVSEVAAATGTPVIAFVGALDGEMSSTAAAKSLRLREIVVVTPEGTLLPEALKRCGAYLAAGVERYFRTTHPI